MSKRTMPDGLIYEATQGCSPEAESAYASACQPAEAEGDRIAGGMVILDGMAFSKDEILRQRENLCEVMEQLLATGAQVEALRKDAERYRWLLNQGDWCQWMNIIRVDPDDYESLELAIDAAMAAKEG